MTTLWLAAITTQHSKWSFREHPNHERWTLMYGRYPIKAVSEETAHWLDQLNNDPDLYQDTWDQKVLDLIAAERLLIEQSR